MAYYSNGKLPGLRSGRLEPVHGEVPTKEEGTMAIYLVQHGKAEPKGADGDPGLNPEGRADVARIASVAAGYGVNVSEIRHSGKKRALETAEIMAEWLKPAGGLKAVAGLAPLDDVGTLARQVDEASLEGVMFVGHLPFMERLTSFLITGGQDRTVMKFQNGGIVCLDREPEGRTWFIKWTLMPKIG